MAAEEKNSNQETQTVDDKSEDTEENLQFQKGETIEQHLTISRKRKAKPRGTTSKKERRRTQNINAAFGDLRSHIPNVPADTKLSKIKTLKLAMSYIRHLEKILKCEETQGESKLERKYSSSSETEVDSESNYNSQENGFGFDALVEDSRRCRRRSTRTGWPQHVWALELMNAKKSRTILQQSV